MNVLYRLFSFLFFFFLRQNKLWISINVHNLLAVFYFFEAGTIRLFLKIICFILRVIFPQPAVSPGRL